MNNLAITNNDIAEALQRSASALAAGNNTLDQNIALITAANEIVQDPARVGNGLKTIAMNIRSINEETGSYDETLESIKDTIYGITGVSAFTDSTKQTYKSTYDYLKDLSLAHKQNQFLKAENRRLRLVSERARSLEIENRLLAKLLNYTRPDEENLVTARVVAEEGDAFSHSLIAYTGKNSTAQKGQIVLTDKGVVGRLDKVGQLYSKILMITDINSRIPVMIENTRVRGILAGDNELNPKLVFTPISADIKEGDRIVTSGVAGVFPAGLPIGVVSHVSKREIRVLPFADLNKVEYVKIVSFPLDEESNLSEAGVVEVRDE